MGRSVILSTGRDVGVPLTRQRRLLPWSFLFLALAGFVFAWGLQYKLSLYYPPPPSRAMPAAKLLSQDERPSETEESAFLKSAAPDGQINHFPVDLQLYLLFLLAACAAPAGSAITWRPERPQASFYTGLTAFFFRPPPAIN